MIGSKGWVLGGKAAPNINNVRENDRAIDSNHEGPLLHDGAGRLCRTRPAHIPPCWGKGMAGAWSRRPPPKGVWVLCAKQTNITGTHNTATL